MLMDQARIERTLKRIAHQVLEKNRNDRELLLLGIDERGFAVATELAGYLQQVTDLPVRCMQLKPDSDELLSVDQTGLFVLLVDDVIFSGATMFKALKKISELEGMEEIHTAALVDRGHRKLPVMAEFVGTELPTKFDEHVSVHTNGKKVKGVELLKMSK